MKEFQELLGHGGALLDREAASLPQASALRARFGQGEMSCSRWSVWALESSVGQRVMRPMQRVVLDSQPAGLRA